MALLDITTYTGGETKALEILASATATNSPPSGASAGVAISEISNLFNFMPSVVSLVAVSTAGSGTMSATFRLWGYVPMASGKWIPIGVGADATKGTINSETAIGESAADGLFHCEAFSLPGHFERLYLEISAISGTATAVAGYLVARRSYP